MDGILQYCSSENTCEHKISLPLPYDKYNVSVKDAGLKQEKLTESSSFNAGNNSARLQKTKLKTRNYK